MAFNHVDGKSLFRVATYVGLVSIGLAGVSLVWATTLKRSVSVGAPIAIASLPKAGDRVAATRVATSLSEPGLVFFGDIMLDRNVRNRMAKAKDVGYPFAKIRTSPELFSPQDIRIANLEGPVTAMRRSPVKEIDFAFDPSVVPMLYDVGITAVSQANNHTLDQGRAGASDSHEALSRAGILAFGDETRSDATSSIAYIVSEAETIALVGLNSSNASLDQNRVRQTMETARINASKVIVFMHWGDEYHDKPNAKQVAFAHWLIDNGADAVIGGHPHWMESVEVYNGKFIAYSLGNFIFDQDWSIETRYGLAVRLSGSFVSLYPIHIVASQPMLTVGAERQARLDRLAAISDPILSDQIRRGEIQL